MSCNFCFQIFCSKNIFFENFTWVVIHMEFVSFPLRTSKLKNDISNLTLKPTNYAIGNITIKYF
jgi:hypothetical protein